VRILSGVFEGVTTGTPIQLMIENTDQRSKDYGEIAQQFRPGHADMTYHLKYGLRDPRRRPVLGPGNRQPGGGRGRGAGRAGRAGAGAEDHRLHGADGHEAIDRSRFDADEIERNPFWCPDPSMAAEWAAYLDDLRLSHNSVGAVIEVVANRRAPRPGRAALWQARQRPGGGDDVDQRRQGRGDRRGHGRGGPDRGRECRRDGDGAGWA
jgi:chorismate synthase